MNCCKIFKLLFAIIVAASVFESSVSAAELPLVRESIYGVYEYSKGGDANALDSASPGESNSDWLAYAIGKYGIPDNYEGYLERLDSFVREKYASSGGLDKVKATEWHRTALTVKSLGGDPTNFGGADLLKDGVTEPLVSLSKQGINGLIWAAITAEECEAEFAGELTLESICNEIIESQNNDGGFSMVKGGESDPDITAMAVRALRRAEGFKSYAELACAALEGMRLPSGGYASFGVENCESTAQAIMAFCAMGKRPDNEVDVLLTYRNADGGFAHTLGGESNAMASDQAMLALIEYEEFINASSGESEAVPAVLGEAAEISSEGAELAPDAPDEAAKEVPVLPENAVSDESEIADESDIAGEPEASEDNIEALDADEEIPESLPEETSAKTNLKTKILSLIGAAALIAAAYALSKGKTRKNNE